jgi:hypothetical protein
MPFIELKTSVELPGEAEEELSRALCVNWSARSSG